MLWLFFVVVIVLVCVVSGDSIVCLVGFGVFVLFLNLVNSM